MNKNDVSIELSQIVNAIRRILEADSRRLQMDNLTCSNAWIIGHLARNSDKDIYQKDIEKEFGITRSTASRVLILMEKKGMIEREGVSHDSRLKRIKLTEKALLLSKELKKNGEKVEKQLIEGFSNEELETLYSFIYRFKENLNI